MPVLGWLWGFGELKHVESWNSLSVGSLGVAAVTTVPARGATYSVLIMSCLGSQC